MFYSVLESGGFHIWGLEGVVALRVYEISATVVPENACAWFSDPTRLRLGTELRFF